MRNRAYCFTINNPTVSDLDQCKNLKYSYIIIGQESGEEMNTLHYQGYVYLKNAMTFKALSKKITRAHIEVANGTAIQNKGYCSKQKVLFEDGKLPQQGKRNDITRVKDHIKTTPNRVMSSLLEQDFCNYQTVRLAEKYLSYNEVSRTKKPTVIWYYGETGSGKSLKAFTENPDAYVANETGQWWDGYDGHKTIIVDDMRRDFYKFHTLLRFLDRYPFRFAVKGGFRQCVADKIIITSCYHPKELYETREDVEQLIRRIDEIVKFKRTDLEDKI